MSNSTVGGIYQQIINDVIEASRVDLEENGVDESILEELKQGWQKKLSQQQLAVFPWDPKPDPPAPAAPTPSASQPAAPAPIANATSAPNGTAYPQQQQQQQRAPVQQTPNALSFPAQANQPAIKTEPGVKIEPGLENAASMPHHHASTHVMNRVASNLSNQYGDRAAASINRLQNNMGPMPNGAQVAGQQRMPGQPVPPAPGHYAPQIVQRMPVQGMPNGQKPDGAQMDGAGDSCSGVLMHQNASGQTTEIGRVEIDGLIRAQIEARAKSMEGGGLMLPLKSTSKRNPVSLHRASNAGTGPAEFDGGDDDVKEEEDQDNEAINSDLDDSDDNLDDDDEDDDGGQIMLCMYDKVQRVKNKWKCVLKDGVLTVNGKDYLFHKATGEYEW